MLLAFSRLGILARGGVRPPKVQIHGLGRRSKSSSKSKDSVSPEKQRPDIQGSYFYHGHHSDARPKADPIDIPTLSWYQRLGPLTRFFGWYDRRQTRNPYVTQLISSLLVYFIGDQLAQGAGGEAYDGKRTLRHLAIGATISLPGYKW
jgi:hypothetical protein